MRNLMYILSISLILSACSKDETTTTPNDPSGPVLPAEFEALGGLFDGDGVGAAINLTEDIVILFSKTGNSYAWFEEGVIHAERSFSDPLSHFDDDFAFDAVGAATLLNGETAYFFDTLGVSYTTAQFDPADADEGFDYSNLFTFSPNVHALTEWGPDNTCPFNAIGAAWPWSDPNNGCFDASVDNDWIHMVDKFGDEFVYYYSPDGGNFDPAEELENWTATNNCNGPDGLIPFDRVGAVFRLIRPNMIQEVFFDAQGTRFCYYAVSEGKFSEVYELY